MPGYSSSDDYYDGDDYYDDGGDDLADEAESDDGTGRPSFKIITKDSIAAAQREDLKRVMELLSLKEQQARSLLVHYRWDVDRVLLLFGDDGMDELLADAGVAIADHNCCVLSQCSSTVQCQICFDDVSVREVTTMDCGHFFCNTCWTEYFIMKINEGQSKQIRCMASKCKVVCDDANVRLLVGACNSSLVEKFDWFLLQSYIEDNRRAKWCLSVPHCGNAIQVEDDELCEVECACGNRFCFRCSSEAHSPLSCQMWELWCKKCQDESENGSWIACHTKPCPKCRKPVYKETGCNLVVCVCGQAFCWLCGGATGRDHTWTSIDSHSCGKYKDDVEKNAAVAKGHHDRYIHYHYRYKAHLDSLKLETEQMAAIHEKISILEEKKLSFREFDWIMSGLYRLSRYRRILSLTYPFAYYMFGNDLFKDEVTLEQLAIKKDLFEDQQQQFEGNIERLSSFLGERFERYGKDAIVDLRTRISAVLLSTDNLCRNLYDCIENDLLGSLKRSGHIHRIAPYKSSGVFTELKN